MSGTEQETFENFINAYEVYISSLDDSLRDDIMERLMIKEREVIKDE